ncbi:hypothetical protein [Actinophytocola sp.]|uniref:hypothetical protein n=1 Tax=Actinophytocola sp. TaxID=1872138 RepID=UPI00389A8BDB
MALWTNFRIMELFRRLADLRAMLGEPDPNADPQLVAELARRDAAARHQGRDAGYDPTHDPYLSHTAEQGPEV